MEAIELFEKYYQGALNSDDKADFENRLVSQPEFKAAYDDYCDMQSFLGVKDEIEEGKKAIEAARAKWENKIPKRNKSGKRNSKLLYMLIVALLAVMLLYFFLPMVLDSKTPAPETLFAQKFNPEKLSITTLGNDARRNAEQGIAYFNDLKYADAYEKLDTNGVEVQNIPTVLLAKGIAGIASDNIEEGRTILENLAMDYSYYRDDAYWYLGLSYIRSGAIDDAISTLEKISVNSNRRTKVNDVLEVLRREN